MTMNRARISLVTIFLISLVIQLTAVIFTYSRGAIAYADLATLLLKLMAIYSVHLGLIVGGIFAQYQDGKRRTQSAPTTAFWLAAILISIWNGLLLWRCLSFGVAALNPDSEDNVDNLSSYLQNISSASSFLVAGSLAFFFTKK